jgi:hypothetical protein
MTFGVEVSIPHIRTSRGSDVPTQIKEKTSNKAQGRKHDYNQNRLLEERLPHERSLAHNAAGV